MASAHPEPSRVLQEELTCPVCLDVYRDPYLLPCGHNFCKTCLDYLKRQAERGRFRCPECRESHRSIAKFQKNFKLGNIADDYRQQRRTVTTAATGLKSTKLLCSSLAVHEIRSAFAVPCDYCPPVAAEASGVGAVGDGSSAASVSLQGGAKLEAAAAPMSAVKTCLKCEVSMCQEHVKPHLELPAFCEHLLTEPINDFWKRKCQNHDEIYRYYCMDDKVYVCNACTIEGEHSGHTMKTLKNTMKDLKGTLDKQLYRVERKYSTAEKKLQEQKEKERQNKTFMDESEQCLNRLGDEMKAKVDSFVTRLRECTRAHCHTNELAIQKNIIKICQDQARLQEVRCGTENLMQENDPFRFIEAYKTTGKQCRKQLRKNMFYPEYIDLDSEVLVVKMKEESRRFINDELACHIVDVINSLYLEEEEEQEENEEEAVEEDDEEDDDDLYDTSEEEIRSEAEEEEEDEEEEGHDQTELADDLYSPGEEEEEDDDEEGEEEEDEEDDYEEDDEERGV
ncbi:E3 ubiquitin/ISG15 ligase TRIM25 isoform X2 [Mastacembelus armatus]|uniref:E3 ubiquitin/ISG15 ligase TRIM25 isoform X2 n=1 Tax=Mastacembelus armatus TaxID=205130 RepID=UPI000E459F7F|nr:E3 ubiquitin/ISG15 ligase TRIM25-like isoform X2 [Mastacembelus armatus]